MKTVQQSKEEIINTLNHIRGVFDKLIQNSGNGNNQPLSFPDAHKLTEGLLLSVWTHWEEFIHEVLVLDLATDNKGFLKKDVKRFRTKLAPLRYAAKILNHPDPNKYIEWDYDRVKDRANVFLSNTHRYKNLSRQGDLIKLKKIRNGIAHKSDSAWNNFRKLVREAPFNLNGTKTRGLTVGRFAFSDKWNGSWVLVEATNIIEACVNELVP